MTLKKMHEISSIEYDDLKLRHIRAELLKSAYVHNFCIDTEEDEIVLNTHVNTDENERESSVSEHIREINDEIGVPLTIVSVTQNEIRLNIPDRYIIEDQDDYGKEK